MVEPLLLGVGLKRKNVCHFHGREKLRSGANLWISIFLVITIAVVSVLIILQLFLVIPVLSAEVFISYKHS